MIFPLMHQIHLPQFLSLSHLLRLAGILILSLLPRYAAADTISSTDKCILQLLQNAPDTMTIGEAKAICNTSSTTNIAEISTTSEDVGVIEERLISENKNILKPFSLMSHGPNYLLMAAYNSKGWASEMYEYSSNDDVSFDKTEVQFQLSIKTPLALDLFDRNLDIYAAYTIRSFWQAYNEDISSPFRETNHQPEIWFQTENNIEFFGIKNTVNTLGLAHQSNGQSGDLSRSWNRIYAAFLFEKENIALLIKPWYRIYEDSSDDDNPDITDYLGHGEIHLMYKKGDHVFSFMSRNNVESNFTKGAVELGWSFPLFHYDYIKGYVQYFSGYGESLIDYNNNVNRIGFGILLTDLL